MRQPGSGALSIRKDFACWLCRCVAHHHFHAWHPRPAAGVAHGPVEGSANERVPRPTELRQRQAKNEADENTPTVKDAVRYTSNATVKFTPSRSLFHKYECLIRIAAASAGAMDLLSER